MFAFGTPLHVGLLSPSHTSGAGNGTEHPEGPNFPRLPNPSLLPLFLCLLAFQENASQVLGNLHAALLPSSTYTVSFSLRLFHMPISTFTLPFSLCIPLSQIFSSSTPPRSPPLWPLAATVNLLH